MDKLKQIQAFLEERISVSNQRMNDIEEIQEGYTSDVYEGYVSEDLDYEYQSEESHVVAYNEILRYVRQLIEEEEA